MNDTCLQNNNVHAAGSGHPTMVMSHGFGCDQTVWNDLLPYFIDRHQVVTYDLTGAGQSNRERYDPKKYGTLHGYADDLLNICHAMQLQDIVYVGHSVSAMIGCLAALREPKLFSHLVLMAPSPCYENVDDYQGGFSHAQLKGFIGAVRADLPSWASQVAPLFMRNTDRQALTQDLCARFCRMDPAIAAHFAEVVFMSDHRSDVARIKTPSLILQCTDDAVAPTQVGQYMHKVMPRNQMAVLKATGHFPHISDPQETAAAIVHYLQSSDAQPKYKRA